jgi:medium-chain acyl-[acyl-carrier-protein] hydrolase
MSTAEIWFAYRRPRPQACLRLFCFPYAGGNATLYRQWSDLLPTQIDVCPIQLPGRGNRLSEPPASHISPLLTMLLPAFSSYLDMPYAFFGYSMGASIAFELVRAFRQRDYPLPVHLFVSARRAPQLPHQKTFVHTLPDTEFLEELRKLNGTPEEVLRNTEILQLSLPTLRADFALCETYAYKPQVPLTCPISAYGGLQDPDVTRDDLAAWRHMTDGAFKVQLFEGDHFFLQSSRIDLLRALTCELFAL